MKTIAAIFDWDGVVIDSSALHERSWELLSEEIRQPLPVGHFKQGFGKKNQVIIPEILGWSHDSREIRALGDRKEELYRELVQGQGVVVLPGARELLGALQAEGIPRAIGSSTPAANLKAIFEATGLDAFFDAVVCGDDVVKGKPDPEVFLKAAEKLSIPPGCCVVFEDALVGIEAGHRAEMKVIAVATTNPLEMLGHADLAVSSLEAVRVADLRRLIAVVG